MKAAQLLAGAAALACALAWGHPACAGKAEFGPEGARYSVEWSDDLNLEANPAPNGLLLVKNSKAVMLITAGRLHGEKIMTVAEILAMFMPSAGKPKEMPNGTVATVAQTGEGPVSMLAAPDGEAWAAMVFDISFAEGGDVARTLRRVQPAGEGQAK